MSLPAIETATAVGVGPAAPRPNGASSSFRRKTPIVRWLVLALSAVYFLGPLLAAFWFTIADNAHSGVNFSAYERFSTRHPTGKVVSAQRCCCLLSSL